MLTPRQRRWIKRILIPSRYRRTMVAMHRLQSYYERDLARMKSQLAVVQAEIVVKREYKRWLEEQRKG